MELQSHPLTPDSTLTLYHASSYGSALDQSEVAEYHSRDTDLTPDEMAAAFQAILDFHASLTHFSDHFSGTVYCDADRQRWVLRSDSRFYAMGDSTFD